MKKAIAIIILVCLLLAMVSCGNMDLIDTVYRYDKAIISFPDGTSKTIEVLSWTDYEDGDQLQITAEDGTVYLVHSVNCVLVREK